MCKQAKPVKVVFQPSGRSVQTQEGATVREAATRAGVFLDYPCGGQGTCGKCRIIGQSGLVEAGDTERGLLSAEDLAHGVRLACQSQIAGDAVVVLPGAGSGAATGQILSVSSVIGETQYDPPVRKVAVSLAEPSLGDDLADFERLSAAMGAESIDFSLQQILPARLRECAFQGTAVLHGNVLMDFEGGDTSGAFPVAAVDIGTTTVVAALVDANTGETLATASRMNPQIRFGDDVLARLTHIQNNPSGQDELQQAIVGELNGMMAELADQANITASQIHDIAIAGNTTMQTLLLGIHAAPLGQAPFVAGRRAGFTFAAKELGLAVHPRGRAYTFPVIGGFVGGDTVAGLIATGITEHEGTVLYIDIGTNGELVLVHQGQLYAASCAAGPAFEGARISQGMRAASGAIERIALQDGDVQFEVLGDAAPSGICGSALIDLAALLLREGLLMSEGLLLDAATSPPEAPQALKARLQSTDKGPVFEIAAAGKSATGAPVHLTQRDVRELQLATTAIKAGIMTLPVHAGLTLADVEHIYVAGAFGNYLRLENAQRMGLLPPALDEGQFTFLGNATLAGARFAALSQRARVKADEIAQRTRHIELSIDPNFHTCYMEEMIFPRE